MPELSATRVCARLIFCAALLMLFTPLPVVAQQADPGAPDSQGQTSPDVHVIPSETTLKDWLLSGDPRLVAWAAYDVLAARDRNLIPDLLALAAQWQPVSRPVSDTSVPTELSPDQTDHRDAMLSVLDALIQMNVPVPADTLRALAPDFGNAVAVLLSRMSAEDSGPLSFEFYRSPTSHDYGLEYVSAALLSLHPLPGFAADLVSSIKVDAHINVVLPGVKPGGVGIGCGACFVPDVLRDGWPATGQYTLTNEKSDGSLLLVAGIDPIYAVRKQSAQYLGDCPRGVSMGPVERRRLVAEMLNIPPEAIEWQVSPYTTIEFQSLQQFDSDLMAFVEEQQDKYRETVAALAERDLLTPSEGDQCLPELILHLFDQRGQGASPLPKPSGLPPRVKWSPFPW